MMKYNFNKTKYLISLLALMCCIGARAGEKRTEFMVDYRVKVTGIDPEYESNAERVRQIVDFLQEVKADSLTKIISVSFCGAASPEGDDELNRRLAKGRLTSLEKVIRNEVEIPESIIARDDRYLPWEYLREKVAASDLPYKDTVISIIDEEPQLVKHYGSLVDHRIVKLKKIDRSRVWQDLFRRYFSKMRNASAVIVTYTEDVTPLPRLNVPAITENMALAEFVPEALAVPSHSIPRLCKPFYMDLRSNMLYDAALLPNIGIEFWLGKQWSVGANWTYGWWNSDKHHRYWRAYGGEVNARYWFGTAALGKPLTGHHVGVYGGAFIYDFEFGGRGQMGGEPGKPLWYNSTYMAGVEYGYSLPIGRRFNMDFTVGFGYLGGKYYEYYPLDGHYVWDKTRRQVWIGPTKAEISIVWLLGHGNYNAGKGGKK